MNKKTLGILVACAGIALSSLTSVAQARDDHRGHDRHERHDRHDRYDRHDRRDFRHDGRGYDRGPHAGHGWAPQARFYGGPPPRHWSRGDRLPPGYHNRYYVVNDWHQRRLYRPNPGYQWVQVGSEFMLVAIASGIIAQVIMSR